MELSKAMETEDGMVVKRLSVPPGLEELMESLTKEVLMWQPKDICTFASDYFARLLLLRDQGHYKEKKAKKTIALSRPMTRDILKDINMSDSVDTSKRPKRMISKQLSIDVRDEQYSGTKLSSARLKKSVSVQNAEESMNKMERRRLMRRRTPVKDIPKKEQASRESSSIRKSVSQPAPVSEKSAKGVVKKTPKAALSLKKKDVKEKEIKENETLKKTAEKKPLKAIQSQPLAATPRTKRGLLSKENIPKSMPIPIPVPVPLPRGKKGKKLNSAQSTDNAALAEKPTNIDQKQKSNMEDVSSVEKIEPSEVAGKNEETEIFQNLSQQAETANNDVKNKNEKSRIVEAQETDESIKDKCDTSEETQGAFEESVEKQLDEEVTEPSETVKDVKNENVKSRTVEAQETDESIKGKCDTSEGTHGAFEESIEKLEGEVTEPRETVKEVAHNEEEVTASYDANKLDEELNKNIENIETESTLIDTTNELNKARDEVINKTINTVTDDAGQLQEMEKSVTGDLTDEANTLTDNVNKNISECLEENKLDINKLQDDLEKSTGDLEEEIKVERNKLTESIENDMQNIKSDISPDTNELNEHLKYSVKNMETEVINKGSNLLESADSEVINNTNQISFDANKLHEKLEKNANDLEKEVEDTAKVVLGFVSTDKNINNITFNANKLHGELEKTADDLEKQAEDTAKDVLGSLVTDENINKSTFDATKLHEELEKTVNETDKEIEDTAKDVLRSVSTDENINNITFNANKLHEELKTNADDLEKEVKDTAKDVLGSVSTDENINNITFDANKLHEELEKTADDLEKQAEDTAKDVLGSVVTDENIIKSTFDATKLHEELEKTVDETEKEIEDTAKDALSSVSTDENINNITFDANKLHEELEKNVDDLEKQAEDTAKDVLGSVSTDENVNNITFDANKLHEELDKNADDLEKQAEDTTKDVLGLVSTDENIIKSTFDATKLHVELEKNAEDIKEQVTKDPNNSSAFISDKIEENVSNVSYDANKLHEELENRVEDIENNLKTEGSDLIKTIDNNLTSMASKTSFDANKLHEELEKSTDEVENEVKDAAKMLSNTVTDNVIEPVNNNILELNELQVESEKEQKGEANNGTTVEFRSLTENVEQNVNNISYDANKLNELNNVTKNIAEEDKEKDTNLVASIDDNNENSDSKISFDASKLHEELQNSYESLEKQEISVLRDLSDTAERNFVEETGNISSEAAVLCAELGKSRDGLEKELTDLGKDLNKSIDDNKSEATNVISFDANKLRNELENCTGDIEKELDEPNDLVESNDNNIAATAKTITYDANKLHDELQNKVDNLEQQLTEKVKEFSDSTANNFEENIININYNPNKLHEELITSTGALETEVKEGNSLDKSIDANISDAIKSISYDANKFREEIDKNFEDVEKEAIDSVQNLSDSITGSVAENINNISYDAKALNEELKQNIKSAENDIKDDTDTVIKSINNVENIVGLNSYDSNTLRDEITKSSNDQDFERENEKTDLYKEKESIASNISSFDANKLHDEIIKDISLETDNTDEVDIPDVKNNAENTDNKNLSYNAEKLRHEINKNINENELNEEENIKTDLNTSKENIVANVESFDLNKLHQDIVTSTDEKVEKDVKEQLNISFDPSKLREELTRNTDGIEDQEKQSITPNMGFESKELNDNTNENDQNLDEEGKDTVDNVTKQLEHDFEKISSNTAVKENVETINNDNTDEEKNSSKNDSSIGYDKNKLHEELNKISSNDDKDIKTTSSVSAGDAEYTKSKQYKIESSDTYSSGKLHEELFKPSGTFEDETFADISEHENLSFNFDNVQNTTVIYDPNKLHEELSVSIKCKDGNKNDDVTDNVQNKLTKINENITEDVNSNSNNLHIDVTEDNELFENDETKIADINSDKIIDSSINTKVINKDAIKEISNLEKKVFAESSSDTLESLKENEPTLQSNDSNKNNDENENKESEFQNGNVIKRAKRSINYDNENDIIKSENNLNATTNFDSNKLHEELQKTDKNVGENNNTENETNKIITSLAENTSNLKSNFNSEKLHEEIYKNTEEETDLPPVTHKDESDSGTKKDNIINDSFNETLSSHITYDPIKLNEEINSSSEPVSHTNDTKECDDQVNDNAMVKTNDLNQNDLQAPISYDSNTLHVEIHKITVEEEKDENLNEENESSDPVLVLKAQKEKDFLPIGKEENVDSNKEIEIEKNDKLSSNSFDPHKLHEEIIKSTSLDELQEIESDSLKQIESQIVVGSDNDVIDSKENLQKEQHNDNIEKSEVEETITKKEMPKQNSSFGAEYDPEKLHDELENNSKHDDIDESDKNVLERNTSQNIDVTMKYDSNALHKKLMKNVTGEQDIENGENINSEALDNVPNATYDSKMLQKEINDNLKTTAQNSSPSEENEQLQTSKDEADAYKNCEDYLRENENEVLEIKDDDDNKTMSKFNAEKLYPEINQEISNDIQTSEENDIINSEKEINNPTVEESNYDTNVLHEELKKLEEVQNEISETEPENGTSKSGISEETPNTTTNSYDKDKLHSEINFSHKKEEQSDIQLQDGNNDVIDSKENLQKEPGDENVRINYDSNLLHDEFKKNLNDLDDEDRRNEEALKPGDEKMHADLIQSSEPVVEEECKMNTMYVTGEPNENDLEATSDKSILYDKQHLHQEIHKDNSEDDISSDELDKTPRTPLKLAKLISKENTISTDSNDVIVGENYTPIPSPSKESLEKEDISDAAVANEKVSVKVDDTIKEISNLSVDSGAESNKDILNDGFGDSVASNNTSEINKEVLSSEKIEPAFIVTEEPIFLVKDNEEKLADISRTCECIVEVDEGALFRAAVTIQAVIRGFLTRRKRKSDQTEQLKKMQQPTDCDELIENRMGIDEQKLNQAATTIQAGVRGYLERKRYVNSKLKEIEATQANNIANEPTVVKAEPVNITRGFLIKRNFSDEIIPKSEWPADVTYKITPGIDGPKIIEVPKIKSQSSIENEKAKSTLTDNEIINAMEKLGSPPKSPSPSNSVNAQRNKTPKKLQKQANAPSEEIESSVFEIIDSNSPQISHDPVKLLRETYGGINDESNVEETNVNYEAIDKKEVFKRSKRDAEDIEESEDLKEDYVSGISFDREKLRKEINNISQNVEKDTSENKIESIDGKIVNIIFDPNELSKEIYKNVSDAKIEEEKENNSTQNKAESENFKPENENSATIVEQANTIIDDVIKTASDVTETLDSVEFVNGHYDKGIRSTNMDYSQTNYGNVESSEDYKVSDERSDKIKNDKIVACDGVDKVIELASNIENLDQKNFMQENEISDSARSNSHIEKTAEKNSQIENDDNDAESSGNKYSAMQTITSSEAEESKLDLANMSHANNESISYKNKADIENENEIKTADINEMQNSEEDSRTVYVSENKLENVESENKETNNATLVTIENEQVSDLNDPSNKSENKSPSKEATTDDDESKTASSASEDIESDLQSQSHASLESLTSNDSFVTVIHNLKEPILSKQTPPPDVSNKSTEMAVIDDKGAEDAAVTENRTDLQKEQETNESPQQMEKINALKENMKDIDEVILTAVIESEWTPDSGDTPNQIDEVIEKVIIRKSSYGARENLAAISIQSGWRGYTTRRDLKLKKLKKDDGLVFDIELSDEAEDADSENIDKVLLTPEVSCVTSSDDVKESTSVSKIDANENNAKFNTPTGSIDLVEKVIAKSANILTKIGISVKSSDEFNNTDGNGDDASRSEVFPEDGIPISPKANPSQNSDDNGNVLRSDPNGNVLDSDIISLATNSSAKFPTENKTKRVKTPLKKQSEVVVIPLKDSKDSLTDSDLIQMATAAATSKGSNKKSGKKKSAKITAAEADSDKSRDGKKSLSKQEGLIHSGEGHDLVIPEEQQVVADSATIPDAPEDGGGGGGLQHSGEMHDLMPLAEQLQAESPAGAEVLTLPAQETHALPGVPTLLVDNSHSGMEAGNRKNSTLRNTDMEEKAATKIQAGFRGYQVRKQLKQTKNNSDSTSTKRYGKRSGSNRRNNEVTTQSLNKPTELEEKSATKIQAGIRGFLVRKRQKNMKKN